jgi:acyl carrier protein
VGQADQTEEKLKQCFKAVFPNLSEAQILSATPETLEQWDSVATVQLATLVEEEFAVGLDLESAASFSEILSYLRKQLALA